MASDLIPKSISLGSTSVAPGASLGVAWLLSNQGATAANSTSTTELRINQSPSSANGTNLVGVSTPALAAGASTVQNASLTAPTTPGIYYVWVIADNFSNVTNQSSTSNDLQHSIAFTVTEPPKSDLVPTNISLGSTSVAPGASLPVAWAITNQGTSAANSTSTTELRITESPSSANGTNLLGVSTPALAAGASTVQGASLTAPTTPGTYYVWVLADNFSNVTNQSNIGNDLQHSVAFTVTEPAKSDLLPTNIALGSTTVAPGASLPVSWTLLNQGAGAANSTSTTAVRINQSSSLATGENLVFKSTAALAPGATASQSTTLTAPTTPGTYYIWVIADNYDNVSNQSSESNDLQHSVAFTVTEPAKSDLVPSNITLGSTAVAPGSSMPVAWAVSNQGTAAANATSTTVVRINQSPTNAGPVDNLDFKSTPALAAGASDIQGAALTAPTTPGTYYVWVIADNFSNVTNQSNIDNDRQHSVAFTVTEPAKSDLVPTNITLSSTAVAPGASLPVAWAVSNQGTAAANTTSTTVVRINQSPTDAGPVDNLDFKSTPALAAGASDVQGAALTAPTSPGTYYVWVIADNFSNVTNQSNIDNDRQHSVAFTVTESPTPEDDYRDSKDDTSAKLGQVAPDGPAQTGIVETPADRDWFEVANLEAGRTYRIKAEGADVDGTGGVGALANTFFTVRNADDDRTLWGPNYDRYDDVEGTNAVLDYKPTYSGTHYIAVGAGGPSFDSLTGGYRLTVTDVTPTSPPPPLTDDAPIEATIGVARDFEQLYPYHTTTWGDLDITLSGLQPQAVVLLQLIDPYGNLVDKAAQGGTSLHAADLEPDTTYQIKVTSQGFAATKYSLKTNFTPHPYTADELFAKAGGKLAALAEFAVAAYEIPKDPNVHLENQPHIKPLKDDGWIIGKAYENESGVPGFPDAGAISAVSQDNQSLVIAFRGTESLLQVLVGDAVLAVFNGLKAHYDAYSNFFTDLHLNNYKHIYVTGHSLGAAMATAFMAEHKPEDNGPKFEAITFANPGYAGQSALPVFSDDNRISNWWFQGDPILLIKNAFIAIDVTKATDNIRLPRNLTPGDDYVITNDNGPANVNLHSQTLYLRAAEFLDGETNNQTLVTNHVIDALINDKLKNERIDQWSIPLSVRPDPNRNADRNAEFVGFPKQLHEDNAKSELLIGSTGDDTYNIGPFTGGEDTIVETGGNDKIVLSGWRGVNFVRSSGTNDLELHLTDLPTVIGGYRGVQRTITIKNFFAAPSARVEAILIDGARMLIPISEEGFARIDNGYHPFDFWRAVAEDLPDSTVKVSATIGNTAVQAGTLLLDGVKAAANSAWNAVVNVGENIGHLFHQVLPGFNEARSFAPASATLVDGLHAAAAEAVLPEQIEIKLVNIQHVVGTDYDDEIIGDGKDNWLTGGSGDDAVSGGGGSDTIIGGSGEGDDTYDGGDDIDVVVYSSAARAIIVDLSAPSDQAKGPEIGTDQITNIENVVAGSGDDVINGNDADNILDGGPGDDHIKGLAGNDTLLGSSGNNTLTGGADADKFVIGTSGGLDTITDLAFSDADAIDFTGVTFATGLHMKWQSTTDGVQTFALVDASNAFLATVNLTGHFSDALFSFSDDGSGHPLVNLLHQPQSLTDTQNFDNDPFSDILLQSTSGQAGIWKMNSTHLTSGAYVGSNPGTSWKVIGTGDFNGDGKSDILWQHLSGQAAIWELDGANVLQYAAIGANPGTSWKVIGTGDFNGDGKSDILWQNTNGHAAIWELDGTSIFAAGLVGPNPGTSWKTIGTGDFDGDGKSDILWQHTDGHVAIWELDGTSIVGAGFVGSNPGANWTAKDTGDYNGDGKSDILLQNTNGQAGIWEMDGSHITGAALVGNADAGWLVI